MRRSALAVALLVLAASMTAAGPGGTHFNVTAAYVPPPRPAANGAVSVTFAPRDPDVQLNEEPAPRLKLDPAQAFLVDKQPPPPAKLPVFDPAAARYLDTRVPVSFPVAVAPKAAKGTHPVKATVTYFYCSKREGWCRKGTADVEVAVTVP
jgi:hypothetical protein